MHAPMHRDSASPLAIKLKILEEMLEETQRLRGDSLSLNPKKAEAFKEKIAAYIAEMKRVDLASLSRKDKEKEDEILSRKIQCTIQRLMEANRNLLASAKANHEIIGDKIARLKKNKNLLKAYNPKQ